MIRYVNFQSIPVEDQDRALAFYVEKLGFKVHTDAPYSEGWRWIFLEIEGATTKLQFARQSEIVVKDVPAMCLVTDDVDKECASLRSLAVTVTDGPADAPWAKGVRYALIRDSEGNLILLESFKG